MALLLLFSCASGFVPVDGPDWILDPPRVPDSVVFVGEGFGNTESEARAGAYRDVLEAMEGELGISVLIPYYREFYSTDRISMFGTYVNGTYSVAADGGYYHFILAVTPSESFYAQRSEEYLDAIERENDIGRLLSSASAHYRANEDTAALEDVLAALSLSLDGNQEAGRYAPEDLLARAMEYVSNITIRVDKPYGDAICLVSVTRDKGPFPPPVRNGRIDVSYTMMDNSGNLFEDSASAMSGSNGRFEFNVTNPYTARRGTLRFSVHLPEDIIEAIRLKSEEGFIDPLLELVAARSVAYPYAIPPAFPPEDTIIAVASYMMDGRFLYSDDAMTAFSDQLRTAGLEYETVAAMGEDEADMLASLIRDYPDKRYIVTVYLGLSDYREAFDSVYVRIDGRVSIIDTDTADLIAQRTVFVSERGEDAESAERLAFERGARIAGGMLLRYL